MFDLARAHHSAMPKPSFGTVNSPVNWRIPKEDCRICDMVKDADGLELMSMYTDLIARGF